jgi:hypothetical protein
MSNSIQIFLVALVFGSAINASAGYSKSTPTPIPMPSQNWSEPNPAPELWNADQIVDCADTVFVGVVKSSHFTSASNQFDPKQSRLVLVPHREEEVDYQIEVTESLRGAAKTGQMIHVIAYPFNEEDADPAATAKRRSIQDDEDAPYPTPPKDLNYRVKFATGKKYLLFDVPSAYSAEEVSSESDPWYKRVKTATSNPTIYQSCKALQNKINHPQTRLKFNFAGLQCSKHEEEMMSPDQSKHYDCEVTCEKDGKTLFMKADYCADDLVVSPDEKYLLGLSSNSRASYSSWIVDHNGTTFLEVGEAKLHASRYNDWTYGSTLGGAEGALIKGKATADVPAPAPKLRARYLERFGPATQTQSAWYNRLNPNIEFIEKAGILTDLKITSYDHRRLSLSSISKIGSVNDTQLQINHWEKPTERQRRINGNLFTAVEHGSLTDAKSAIAKGANPKANQTLFWTALNQGNFPMVYFLMESGVDSRSKSKKGVSPLSYASFLGNLELVTRLIQAGAPVNEGDEKAWGWTPLMRAAMMGHLDVVQALLKAGADRSAQDLDHKTALQYAQERKHPEIEKLLSP